MTFIDGGPEPDGATVTIPTAALAPRSPSPYTFRVHKAQKLVAITIIGFWSLSTLARFAVDLHRAVSELDCVGGEHKLCCDVSGAAIQGQDILSGFRDLIVSGPTRSSKLALWTTSPLSRMQARRLLGLRDDIAVFDNEADAKRWLRS